VKLSLNPHGNDVMNQVQHRPATEEPLRGDPVNASETSILALEFTVYYSMFGCVVTLVFPYQPSYVTFLGTTAL
jgi:hypothetical protein